MFYIGIFMQLSLVSPQVVREDIHADSFQTRRRVLIPVNILAAVAPVLGYIARPTETDLGEVVFDVSSHVIRALSLYTSNPNLTALSNAIDGLRLALISRSTFNGDSSFPAPIVIGDTL